MYVKFLELRNYRNYSLLNLNLSKGLNIFVGENAQGKTNVVEAIYYLSTLRSHRTSKDKELINWEKERAYIKGIVDKNYGSCTIEILLSSLDKKGIKINGVKLSKASEVMGSVNAVMFSPEDLRLVKEGPAVRRRFIDNELYQIRPKYHHTLQQYNHVLLQRNNLLKTAYKSPSVKFTAEVFSEQLAEYGAYITEVRHEFIKKLSLISRLIHRKITNGREELEISYECDSGEFKDRKSTREYLLSYYLENIDDDIKKGYTLRGPHRDDLLININGTDVRAYGSQGQQRTAALSLKLSELEIIKSEVGEYPILILDDVLSELDITRQNYLLDTLKNVQTILTCTSLNDINEFHFEEKEVFVVREGTVERRS
jgi:DNA replication and repair protein RecF